MRKTIAGWDWEIEESDGLVVLTTVHAEIRVVDINAALTGAGVFMEELSNDDLANADDYDVVLTQNGYRIKVTISRDLFDKLIS